jgi:curved DNA-binding protein CbpA
MPLLSSKGEPLQNPYELLKLEHGATDDEISKSFKKLMLQLHPDKQPPGQSIEEAKNVERLMYDVMEARSFLLDTEYMSSRRMYDSKLVLAKQQKQQQQQQQLPPRSTGSKKEVNIGMTKQQQETKINPVPAATLPVPSTKVGGGKTSTTRAKSTSKSRLESATDNNNNNSYNTKATTAARETKSTLDGAAELSVEKLEKLLAAKKAEKSNTNTLLNKNLNKKQWGKVKTRCRAAANVTKKKVDDSSKTKKKDNSSSSSRRIGKASFSSSCSGDCSTTEDNTTTSDDDLKLNSINSDTAVSSSKKSAVDVDPTTTNNNNKPSSSTTAKLSVLQPSNNNSSSNSNKGKQKSFHDSLPQLPEERQKSFHNSQPQPRGRQKSFHDSRPQLLQPPSQPIIEKCERSKSFSGTPLHPLLHPTTVKGKCYQQIFQCDIPIEVVKPPKIYDHLRPTFNDTIPVPQRRSCPSTIGYTSTSLHPTATTTTTSTLLLEKQYYCPLTKNIMKEPMSDNEGNTYERQAILTYLEIHNNKSPITGNALSPMQLIPNISLAEQIRLALITCLDMLREYKKKHFHVFCL